MKKILLSITVVALCLGTIAMIRSESAREQNPKPRSISQIANGPYRDGLYLGTLATKRGRHVGIPTGRWAQPEDRAAFAAGFQEGRSACYRVVAR
jgi:hypothetical protein